MQCFWARLAGAARTVRDECGQTMAEYGIIAAVVSIAAIAALETLGPAIQDFFTDATAAIAGG